MASNDCCPPTVTGFPKAQNGDFTNVPMMVMLSTGELIGWGDNTTGALANGVTTATAAPAQKPLFDPNTTPPPPTATIVDWTLTNGNLYVVYSNGWVYSAGSNAYGQLGHGDTTSRPYLKRIEYFVTNNITVTKVWACGSHFTTGGGGCVYFQASDYSMWACGENVAGNLGNANTPTSNVDTPAPCAGIAYSGTDYVVDVAITVVDTSFSAYMLYNTGALFVAGYNGQGQLGVNSTSNVTGSFVTAQVSGGGSVSNFASISVNGSYYYNGTTWYPAGNALGVDTSGNIWVVGYNAHYELGMNDTTERKQFTQNTQNPQLTNVVQAGIGGGLLGYGYAVTNTGALYTWGYNGQDNLFQNNTTDPKTPTLATFTPGVPAKIFLPLANRLQDYAQLIMLTTGGILAYAGTDNGQVGIPSSLYPNAFTYLPTPRQLLDGTENITDVFIHGWNDAQRWFILTDAGNLYACGGNSLSVCTGGVASDVAAANVEWCRIAFPKQ